MWPALLAANKIGPDQITLVFMDPAAKPIATMDKKTDCLLGGIDDQTVIMESKGVPVKVIRFADVGVNTLSVSVFTTTTLIKNNPDLVRRFVRATEELEGRARRAGGGRRGRARGQARPQPRIDAQAAPGRLGLVVLVQHRGPGHRLGAAADWEHTKDFLPSTRELKTDRDGASFYTNEFLAEKPWPAWHSRPDAPRWRRPHPESSRMRPQRPRCRASSWRGSARPSGAARR